jgi:TatD DNase family protein
VRLFDSHAHLTDERFVADLGDTLARAAAAGVESVVSIASDLDDAEAARALTAPAAPLRVFATAGIHPHAADLCTTEALARLEALARSDAVVAIGETGLDFHYENAPRAAQIAAFRAQLELASRLGLPVVVHAREADAEVGGIVREFAGRALGVLHCFSGGAPLLAAALASDWYVSFSGTVTFHNFADFDAVRQVPESRLLVETDSPYLAPAPFRGRRNEPAFVKQVALRVAEIRDADPLRLAAVSYENACRFYGVEPR